MDGLRAPLLPAHEDEPWSVSDGYKKGSEGVSFCTLRLSVAMARAGVLGNDAKTQAVKAWNKLLRPDHNLGGT